MREPRAVAAVALAGALALLFGAAVTSTDRAFTLGVLSGVPSPGIAAGKTACQQPITVPPGGGFDTVDFQVGTFFAPGGPPLEVTVRPLEPGAFPERRGLLEAGYPDVGVEQRQRVRVGPVPDDARVAVCFRNRGPGTVALFGAGDVASRESSAFIAGRPFGFDFDLVFRGEERSLASRLGDVVQRASLFRPPWLPPGVYWALLVVLLAGLPALLARAVRGLGDTQPELQPQTAPRATLEGPGGMPPSRPSGP